MIRSLIRRHALAATRSLLLAGLAVASPGWAWLGGPAPQKPEPVTLAPLHPVGSPYQSVVLGGALWLPREMPDGVALRGLSDLAWSESEGVLYAVSDFGWLFRLQPVFENNRLIDVRLLDSYPLTDAAGRPLKGRWRDAEGLTFAPGPDGAPALFVSFERVPRITRIDRQGRWQADVPLPAPFAAPQRYDTPNTALEALTWHPRRGLLSAAELPPPGFTPAGHTPLFDLAGRQHPYLLHTGPRCALVALNAWAGDELLSLERCYDEGRIEIALRRFDLPQTAGFAIRPKTLALFRLQDGWLLDNFEGMTRIGPRGLLLVSDDNGSTRQRTLLMYLQRRD
ncbi:MAG TPA: esterase-like activity of phytase family protein [Candidatus Acidoferrales bacterium]|nr:esterase-like activity of phytase family protein [Candidatus Acidoferrales bacterium]